MRKILSIIFLVTFLGGWSTSDNNVSVGNSSAGNKTITANIGNGATNPKFRWNTGSNFFDMTFNGSTFYEIVGRDEPQTITAKVIDGDDNTVQDLPETALKTNLSNASKFFTRNASGIPESTAKAVPTGAVVGASDSQTLTNKNLANSNNTLSGATATGLVSGSGTLTLNTSGTVTLPNATDTLVGKATTDTLTNKTLNGNTATNLISGSGTLTLNTSGTMTLPNATDTVVGKATTDTLTNKTLTTPQVNSGILLTPNIDDYTDVNEETAPSSPSAGKLRVYAKSDHKLYKKDNGGTESEVGGGSGGSGEINVITNPNNADAGWTASAAGITVGTTTTGSDLPLSTSAISSAIKITPVSSTDYVYIRWTMPTALKNKKLKTEWYQHYLTGYASGDLKLEIHTNSASNYGGTDATLVLSTDTSAVTAIPAFDGKFTSYFDANSSDYYELRIKRVAGTTADVIGNVVVGPGIQPQGAVVSDSQSITPVPNATAFGTVSLVNFKYEREGSWMRLHGYFKAGTVTANDMKIALPAGFTINYSAGLTTTNAMELGTWYGLSGSTGFGTTNTFGGIFADGSDTSNIYMSNTPTSAAFDKSDANNLSSSSGLTIDCRIPIAEWAGSGTVNLAQNDVEFGSNSSSSNSSDTTSFAYGPAGSQFSTVGSTSITKRVRFLTPIQSTDQISFEMSTDSGVTWGALTMGGYVSDFEAQNGSFYGIRIDPVNSTDIDMTMGAYRIVTGTTFGAAGGAWSTISGSATYKWRVKKIKAGVAVGFGLVSQYSAGLVPADNSNLDNASATRLGLKSYYHGTTYNGAAPTVSSATSTLSSVDYAEFVPYETQTGWRLRFNINTTFNSTSRTGVILAVNGVLFKNITGLVPVALITGGSQVARQGFVTGNTNQITLSNASTATDLYNCSGDVALESKPTWAY